VQKCRGNRDSDCAAPFPLAADATYIFEENYRVRLNVATPQPGYFYVLNELADKVEGTPVYKILYPAVSDKAGAASQLALPENEWFRFDNQKVTEKLWIVWGEQPVAELETVKGLANSSAQGKVKDPAQ